MILKFVIKCIKMSLARIMAVPPTNDISRTCNMRATRQLPKASAPILTFTLLIWTPHHLPQAFLLFEGKKEAIVTDAEVSATARCQPVSASYHYKKCCVTNHASSDAQDHLFHCLWVHKGLADLGWAHSFLVEEIPSASDGKSRIHDNNASHKMAHSTLPLWKTLVTLFGGKLPLTTAVAHVGEEAGILHGLNLVNY